VFSSDAALVFPWPDASDVPDVPEPLRDRRLVRPTTERHGKFLVERARHLKDSSWRNDCTARRVQSVDRDC